MVGGLVLLDGLVGILIPIYLVTRNSGALNRGSRPGEAKRAATSLLFRKMAMHIKTIFLIQEP